MAVKFTDTYTCDQCGAVSETAAEDGWLELRSVGSFEGKHFCSPVCLSRNIYGANPDLTVTCKLNQTGFVNDIEALMLQMGMRRGGNRA